MQLAARTARIAMSPTMKVTADALKLKAQGVDIVDFGAGEPTANAAALRAVLNGAPGAFRDIVLMNAAAALVIADRAKDLREGVAMATAAIDSGKARAALARLIEITHEPPPPEPEADDKPAKTK